MSWILYLPKTHNSFLCICCSNMTSEVKVKSTAVVFIWCPPRYKILRGFSLASCTVALQCGTNMFSSQNHNLLHAKCISCSRNRSLALQAC